MTGNKDITSRLKNDENYVDDITLNDETEDLEEIETSFDRETQDFDYDVETDYSEDEEIRKAKQLKDCLSFDSIKLLLPLKYAEEVEFDLERNRFFRSLTPERPPKKKEDMLHLIGLDAENPVRTMELTTKEKNYTDKSMEYEYAKMKYPNAKPFYDYVRRLGAGHMYFKDGNFICQINGKITSSNGDLGLINKNNIDQALNKLKGGLVRFNNSKFIEKAQVILTHVTNDIEVSDINSYVKAFSSYLPLRTDKYSVLKYGATGYEILARGKQSKDTAKQSFCIYVKSHEIKFQDNYGYLKSIGKNGLRLSEKVLRLELRLYNYKAIREYFAPNMKDGTITLQQLLNSTIKPIVCKLNDLKITTDNLIKARGEYISFKDDKLLTLATFQKMHGLIHLLKLNDYSLDKVRSHIEVETGKKVRSDELNKCREVLQRYIACYKPRTVALLSELLACISY